MFTLAPSQEQVFTCLVGFLSGILPAGIEIIQAQDNLVSEPANLDFVVMTPTRRQRLMAQDVDDWGDVAFTASIAGNLMSVTAILVGGPAVGSPIGIGQQLFGTGLVAGSTMLVLNQMSGSTGGTGVYLLSGTTTIPSQTLAAGVETLGAPVQFSVQLDVHGPNSADNSSVISAAFRDDYAFQAFASQVSALTLPLNSVTPLYADEARQVPFVNAEDQYENRWIVEAELEINQSIVIPLQFFTAAQVVLKDVDVVYPP